VRELELKLERQAEENAKLARELEKKSSLLATALEQKKDEHQLRISEERYRVLADAIPSITWMIDAQGKVQFFNQRWYEYTGMSASDVAKGKWWLTMHVEDQPAHKARRLAAIKNGTAFGGEFRLRAQDGSYRWFESRVVPLRGQDGQVLAWYGSAIDIEDHKRVERELTFAKEAAEHAARLKSQFLANMSHEIRTPMNAILGFGELLSEEGLTDAERVDFSARIKANGRQLLRIIDDILDISKLEAGKVLIEHVKCGLSDVLREVIDSLRPLAEKKGLELRLDLQTPVPQFVRSDPTRLKQILMNLIGNAIKFTPSGWIEVRLAHVPALDGPEGGGGSIRVEIEDTGIGIDPARQAELFQPFGQADSSITREFGGTGLGLVLSQRLAQALGGSLVLTRSQPGAGSCFTLKFETGEGSGVALISELDLGPKTEVLFVRRETRAKAARLRGRHVLLVEDTLDGEALATRFLRLEGAEVEVARDGYEAVEKADAASFDVVLMDIQMPRLDGLSATRILRERGYARPIIALTAHALREEIDNSLQAGCDDHLTKPINREALVAAINRIAAPLEAAADEAAVAIELASRRSPAG
jgi:PAS domain S-box-containing protein